MPTGKTYVKSIGRWVKKRKEQGYDYDNVDGASAGLMVSFYRWYPDYYADLCRSPNATYGLELLQRIILRSFARYRITYDTGTRGATKTFCIVLYVMINGILFPGEVVRYTAPSQKQAVILASQAFKQIEHDYPSIASNWYIKSDSKDMFKIETQFGSQFTMFAPRGDNSSMTIGEEMGQEEPDPFDMDTYEKDVYPTCRIIRQINGEPDPCHINLKHLYISNACSRQNPAFYKYRNGAVEDMLNGENACVLDISWEAVLCSGIRDIEYFKDMKKQLTKQNHLREMCATYIGTRENPVVTDEDITNARTLLLMEDRHCGDPDAIYIVAHDVAFEDGKVNAKCADAVVKLTPYDEYDENYGRYRKDIVFLDTYPPTLTDLAQAMKLKRLWARYCMNGGQTTYLVIDANNYGKAVVEKLMEKTDDGLPTLCCYRHMRYKELEKEGALPVIYPMKAGGRGTQDEDGSMVIYAQLEFDQGRVRMLTTDMVEGVEQYRLKNRIKDTMQDVRIQQPYLTTNILVQQIQNLTTEVSGATVKEKRRSNAIPRDLWSAVKYAFRMANILEDVDIIRRNRKKSKWADEIARGIHSESSQPVMNDIRSSVLRERMEGGRR